MLLQEVKDQLGVSTLNLNVAKDKDNKPTSWLRAWDNDNRVAVSLHQETFDKLKADSTISTVGLQTETRTGAKGDYTSHRIVIFTPATHQL